MSFSDEDKKDDVVSDDTFFVDESEYTQNDDNVESNSEDKKDGRIMKVDELLIEDLKLKKESKKKEQEIKIKRQNEMEKRERIKRKIRKIYYPIIYMFKSIIDIKTYIKLIQFFEPLLMVLFIDCLTIFTLFGLIYIIFLMINYKFQDGLNLEYIYKLVSCIVLVILCYIVQKYVQDESNVDKQPEEYEED